MSQKVSVGGHERLAASIKAYADNLAALEELYASTGNPIFVWEALAVLNVLRAAQHRGLPVPPLPTLPEWTLDYLLGSAGEIARLAADSVTGSNPMARIPHALGLVDGTKTNRFVQYRRMRRAIDLEDTKRKRRAAGSKRFATVADVEATFGGSRNKITVSRARKRGAPIRDLINKRLNPEP